MDIDGDGHVPGEDNTEVISSLEIRIISVLKKLEIENQNRPKWCDWNNLATIWTYETN